MPGAQDDFAAEDLVAAGQAEFFRVLVPLVQHVEFLVRGFAEVFHAADHLGGAGAARAVEAAGLHLHASRLAGLDEVFTVGDFRGDVGGENCDLGHAKLRRKS
jgi:hypothetical protein